MLQAGMMQQLEEGVCAIGGCKGIDRYFSEFGNLGRCQLLEMSGKIFQKSKGYIPLASLPLPPQPPFIYLREFIFKLHFFLLTCVQIYPLCLIILLNKWKKRFSVSRTYLQIKYLNAVGSVCLTMFGNSKNHILIQELSVLKVLQK